MSDEEVIPVPLYHGTCSIFIPSILRHGLGAVNPLASFRALAFLSTVVDAGGDRLWADSTVAGEEMDIRSMVDQRVTGAGFNYRHGSTYLTASRFKAVSYARSNRYGSELLSNGLLMFERLRASDPTGAEQIATSYPDAVALLARDHESILIEVRDVSSRMLRSESGGDAAPVLNKMLRILADRNSNLASAMLQGFNFELVDAVPATQLTCYRIRSAGEDPMWSDYELERV